MLIAAVLALPVRAASGPAALTIDYPAEGSLFPPEIGAPTFLWRDASRAAQWRIEITFTSGGPPLRLTSRGPRPPQAAIDPDCVSTSNQPPPVDPLQRAWKPGIATWTQIKRRSQSAPASITFTGLRSGRPVSKAAVRIQTSTDPAGAPIFYRDVPLMPARTETGIIQPLAPHAVRLVRWRLRDISQPRSRVLLENLPVCANCHSFSLDGTRMGMDLDGLRNNKGQYFVAGVQPRTRVGAGELVQWRSAEGELRNPIRVGFMSQLAPHGNAVVTTIDTPGARSSNYYVANFADYRFLQVFFPTRGILAWAGRGENQLRPLPGADDPAYVQFGAVWSPDGESLVFARAPAQDPNPPGAPEARFANDPNELQIRYDLYRIPFHGGRGGRAEPIAGASRNGMSNTFPKLSPDGRWLVYVQSRNGQLMRPDSQLYIVPAAGGAARRMNCNTRLMNSWHSFSPNSRWMVFASKARSPYTQMYLTHIDEQGNDTPPILIEDSTAANRAVNLPEFVNVPPGALQAIGGPALDYYRLYDRALYLRNQRRYGESAAAWQALLALAPDDAAVRRQLGMALLLAGRRAEALPYLEQTPAAPRTPLEEAIARLEAGRDAPHVTVSANPTAQEHYYFALRLPQGSAETLHHLRECIRLHPNHAGALRRAAWLLATRPARGDAAEALALAVRALLLDNPPGAATLDTLAAAYAASGRFEDAIAAARRAIAADPAQAPAITRRIERYSAGQPWRE